MGFLDWLRSVQTPISGTAPRDFGLPHSPVTGEQLRHPWHYQYTQDSQVEQPEALDFTDLHLMGWRGPDER